MNRFSETRLRVRYAETDQMGVVYYSNHLVWMEVARTDFCRHTGFRYRDLEVEDGIMIAVVEARCRYHRPAHYDDEILIRTSLTGLKRRTLTFSYRMANAETGAVVAEGATTHVAIRPDGRPSTIPPRQRALLSAFLVAEDESVSGAETARDPSAGSSTS